MSNKMFGLACQLAVGSSHPVIRLITDQGPQRLERKDILLSLEAKLANVILYM
jgi:hypothetical protein